MKEIKTYTFVNGDGQIIEVVSKQQVLKVIAERDEKLVEILEPCETPSCDCCMQVRDIITKLKQSNENNER